MPAWVGPLVAQLWSFVAVALAVNALGTVSKRIADKLGWRSYRGRDVRKVLAAARTSTTGSDPDMPLPADASWYDITLRLHPLIAGACFGFLPLPTLEVIDAIAKDPEAGPNAALAARCAWFMLAGALSGQVYEAVKFAFSEGRARILGLLGRPASSSTPATTTTTTAPAASEEPPTDVSSGNEDR